MASWGERIWDYGREIDSPDLGLYGIASRAVFVLDADGTVTDRWVAEDSTNEPDDETGFDAVAET